jgi:hypothetical protein
VQFRNRGSVHPRTIILRNHFHDGRLVVAPVTVRLSSSHITDITGARAPSHSPATYWSVGAATIIDADMGEHTEQRIAGRTRLSRKRPAKQSAEAMGRRLLEIVVYDKSCRTGGTLTLDDLAETSEVGDWKMPDFKAACTYVASQGWLIVEDDVLTLMTAGLAAA